MRPHLGASSARSGVTRQTLTATVAPSATLALLPDFLTCFRCVKVRKIVPLLVPDSKLFFSVSFSHKSGADYEQSQEIRMLRGGNLVLVDWYTSGRMGRGESWVFHRLSSNTRVYMDGQLLLWEPLLLEGGKDEGATCSKPSSASASSSSSRLTALATRMGSYHCFCLLVLIGPRLADLIQQVSRSQGRPTFQAWERGAAGPAEHRAQSLGDSACVSSLCHLIDGTQGKKGQGLALKIAGKATEDVRQLLKSFLAPLASVVGTEPYSGM